MQAIRLLSSPKQLMGFILMYQFLSCYFIIPADAQSFTLKMNRAVPLKGSSLILSCQLSFTVGAIQLRKGSELVADCASSKGYDCLFFYGHNSTANQTGVLTTINSLNRENEGTYICSLLLHSTENRSNNLTLVVYTIPSRVDFTQVPNMNVDLSVTSARLQCTTSGCTYPTPLIQWLTQVAPKPSRMVICFEAQFIIGSARSGKPELHVCDCQLMINHVMMFSKI